MSPPVRFTVEWWYAGHHGYERDARVQWRSALAIDQQNASFKQATATIVVPFNAARLSGAYPASSGRARIYVGERTLLAGSWRPETVEIRPPFRNGHTEIVFSVRQSIDEDQGEFPPAVEWRPRRSASDQWELWNAVFDGDPNTNLPAEGGIHFFEEWDETYIEKPRTATGAIDETADYTTTLTRDEVFPEIPELSEGAYYPWIFGTPGYIREDRIVPAVPAYIFNESPVDTDDEDFVLAGGAVNATRCMLFGPTTSTETDSDEPIKRFHQHYMTVRTDTTTAAPLIFATTNYDDDETATDIPAIYGVDTFTLAGNANYPFFSAWTEDVQPGRAGDLLMLVAPMSSLPISASGLANLAHVLNRYKLAGYVDRPQSPMSWLRSSILPLLPITFVLAPSGLEPVLLPWHEDWTGATGTRLVHGYGVTFSENGFEHQAREVPARVQLRFALRKDTGRLVNSTATTPRRALADTPANAGPVELETDYVYDAATAQMIVRDQLRARAWLGRTIGLSVTDFARFGPGGTDELYAGKTVRLTREDMGLEDAPAFLLSVEQTSTSVYCVAALDDRLSRPYTLTALDDGLPPESEDEVATVSAFASPPTSPVARQTWHISDGPYLAVRDAANTAWTYTLPSYGEITRPVLANWNSWTNQGTSTLTEVGGALMMTLQPTSSSGTNPGSIRSIEHDISGSTTVTIFLRAVSTGPAGVVGCGFRVDSTGKESGLMQYNGRTATSTLPPYTVTLPYTNGAYVSGSGSGQSHRHPATSVWCVQLEYDAGAGTITFRQSADGQTWGDFDSEAIATNLNGAPDRVWIGAANGDANNTPTIQILHVEVN